MDPHFIIPDDHKEFYTPERCHILELLNNPGTPYSIARARVLPGITTSWHLLKSTAESYYILEGSGQMEIGETTAFPVKKAMLVNIPPDTAQRITNTGIEDLIFLCICVPAFRPETYVSLE